MIASTTTMTPSTVGLMMATAIFGTVLWVLIIFYVGFWAGVWYANRNEIKVGNPWRQ